MTLVLTGATLVIGAGIAARVLIVDRRQPISWKRLLVACLLIGGACRVVIALTVPTFYAPDEASHFKYVRYLADECSFPVQASRTGDVSNDWEYYQPPLYYLVMAPVFATARWAFESKHAAVDILRLASVLMWAGSVWFVLRTVGELRITETFTRAVVLAVFCFLPTYAFSSAVINNDNLLLLIGSAVVYRLAQPDATYRRSLGTGVLIGLAFLTKESAVVYLVLAVALLGLRWIGKRESWRRLGLHGVLLVVPPILMWLPWGLRNLSLYGSFDAVDVGNTPYEWPSLSTAALVVGIHLQKSFWAVSGIHSTISSYFPLAGVLVSIVALVGIGRGLAREKGLGSIAPLDRRPIVVLALLITLAVNVALVVRFGLLYHQGQGRLLFPLLLPIALLLGSGLEGAGLAKLERSHLYVLCGFALYTLTFMVFSFATIEELRPR